MDVASPMRFYLLMAVWGPKYIGHFLDITLPSLLAAQNLSSLPNLAQSRFVFITRKIDEPLLHAAPLVGRLKEMIEVRVLHIEPARHATRYLALAEAHHLAALEAHEARAFAIVLSPDMILSDGSLAAIARYARAGKRAILVSGLRLAEETAVPALKAQLAGDGGSAILQPRALMRFAVGHLHPAVQRDRFDSAEFARYPINCLWPMGDGGFLQRSFHLHPILLDLSNDRGLDALSHDTIDGSFVGRAIGRLSDIHVEEDSDNILVFSVASSAENLEPHYANRASAGGLRRSAYLWNVNGLHRLLFFHAIKLHVGDLDDEWRRVEEESCLLAFEALDISQLSIPALIVFGLWLLRHRIIIALIQTPVGRAFLAPWLRLRNIQRALLASWPVRRRGQAR
jgi:hypothetical protein